MNGGGGGHSSQGVAMCQRCFPLRIRLLLLFMILRMSSLCICSALSRTSLRVVDAIALACASLGLQWPIGVRAHSTKRMTSSWTQSGRVSIGHICMASPHCPPLPGYNLIALALQAWILSAKLFLSFDKTFAKCLHLFSFLICFLLLLLLQPMHF